MMDGRGALSSGCIFSLILGIMSTSQCRHGENIPAKLISFQRFDTEI